MNKTPLLNTFSPSTPDVSPCTNVPNMSTEQMNIIAIFLLSKTESYYLCDMTMESFTTLYDTTQSSGHMSRSQKIGSETIPTSKSLDLIVF